LGNWRTTRPQATVAIDHGLTEKNGAATNAKETQLVDALPLADHERWQTFFEEVELLRPT
jgi:hypothetical protein